MSTAEFPDLVLEDVSKSFGEVRAVDRVSIEVEPGEFYSLLGPSGCGKTTTLRMVAGFEEPDSGRIVLAGTDVTRTPPSKRKVNTVFQHYALFPHLSVEDNVAYGLRQQGISDAELSRRLNEVLATVRLVDLRERYPRELSGGQQQRVALARALVNEPTVLLLDEPLAALDLKLRKAMQGELKKLQERVGITFVYVTHDQEEALTLSDRIAVMNEGGILQEGTPSEIYERPRTRFVADFIGQTNFFSGVVEATGDETLVREEAGFLMRCAAAAFVTQGARVSISIRPENLVPASDGADANLIEGTLSRRTYLGDLVQYHVELGGGREVTVQRQNAHDDPTASWRTGEPVRLSWDSDTALLLEEEGGAIADEDSRRLVDSGAPRGTGGKEER